MQKVYADVMLAKLSRWLRLAGIPVYNAPYEDDTSLLAFVIRNRGTLLTSDLELFARAEKRNAKVVLVKQEPLVNQIARVANALNTGIRTTPAEACPICNSKLVKVNKKDAEGIVPELSYRRYRLFYLCKSCKKAYWHGTHWKRIRSRLSRAKKLKARMRTI